MKIGIIGTGNMGRSLGLRWAHNGHSVFFGSRDRSKAEAVAADAGSSTQAGDFDAAAAYGEVILYTVREPLPSSLLRQPQALAGKVVIDCNNSDIPDDFDFIAPIPSLAEKLAADVPQARVVKAFNTMSSKVIELDRETLASQRVSVFLCSNDAAAKAIVSGLAEELGFIAVDSGELKRARLVEGVADFIRFQILGMRRGFLATISMNILPEPSK
ncbi:MAG: NAD(P)-binding domain-containing protein [Acidobacteriota bacterium]